jgi:hypothetical protein
MVPPKIINGNGNIPSPKSMPTRSVRWVYGVYRDRSRARKDFAPLLLAVRCESRRSRRHYGHSRDLFIWPPNHVLCYTQHATVPCFRAHKAQRIAVSPCSESGPGLGKQGTEGSKKTASSTRYPYAGLACFEVFESTEYGCKSWGSGDFERSLLVRRG